MGGDSYTLSGRLEDGPRLWGILFAAGVIFFVIGICMDPFASVGKRLTELRDRLEAKRSKYLHSIRDLDSRERAEALEKFDRYEDLVLMVMVNILAGQSGSFLHGANRNATYADLLTMAGNYFSANQKRGQIVDKE